MSTWTITRAEELLKDIYISRGPFNEGVYVDGQLNSETVEAVRFLTSRADDVPIESPRHDLQDLIGRLSEAVLYCGYNEQDIRQMWMSETLDEQAAFVYKDNPERFKMNMGSFFLESGEYEDMLTEIVRVCGAWNSNLSDVVMSEDILTEAESWKIRKLDSQRPRNLHEPAFEQFGPLETPIGYSPERLKQLQDILRDDPSELNRVHDMEILEFSDHLTQINAPGDISGLIQYLLSMDKVQLRWFVAKAKSGE